MDKKISPAVNGAKQSCNVDYTTNELLQQKISVYKNIKDNTGTATTIKQIFDDIRGGKHKARTDYLKSLPEGEYGEQKPWTENALFQGIGNPRTADNITHVTGLMFIDVDEMTPQQTEELFHVLKNDVHVFAVWKSLRHGLRVLFRANYKNRDDYRAAYIGAEQYFLSKYGVKTDPKCKNINRVAYLSHDPNLFINPDCKVFEYESAPKEESKQSTVEAPKVSDKYIQSAIDGELNRIVNAPKGQGNDALNCAAMAIGQLFHTGKIDKQSVKSSFIDAYMNRGGSYKNEAEASASFESGWNKGITEPREADNKSAELRAIIEKAAKLDSVEYACQRDAISKKIGIGKTALDKLVREFQKAEIQSDDSFPGWVVEPWPEAVDGSELLNNIYATISNFVIADRESKEAASAWVVLTWLADYATVLPMAMVTAPEKGCGKTVFLSVLEKLSCRPLQTSCITPSALFRSVDAWKPTLLIDEADTFCRENEELRGILNSGHTRNSAYVIKTEEIAGERIPKRFNTWAPKAIAGIKLESLNATLTSRSIILPLRRKKADESVQNLRHCDSSIFEVLKQKIYRWSLDNGEAFSKLKPELEELQNRDSDNWEPLLAIGKITGDEWFSRIKHAAIKITGAQEESPSLEHELLSDIKKAFQVKAVSRISTANLLDELLKDELAAWITYNRGFPMKPRQLANKLKSYGISPKPLRINGIVFKGYELHDFDDVFERYIFSDHGNHRLQVTNNIESGINAGLYPVTDSDDVTVTLPQELHAQSKTQSYKSELCNHVTDISGHAEKKVSDWEEVEI